MKIIPDSALIKSRLKDYDPKLNGIKMKASKNYDVMQINSLIEKYSLAVNNNERTQIILDLADQIREQDGVPSYSICQKGCAHCCKIPVSVTAMEAILIGEYLGRKPKELFEINPVANKYNYCPFLDLTTASCSIYKVRPLHCRNFQSFDHYKYCQTPDVIHNTFHTYSSERLEGLLQTLIEASQGYTADIREWF
ncbi:MULTISPECIES: YkgJ family cysteine cluster protein [Enterobacteriaceae]|uniref:YkgJ family cysteine cluster protein n=1 Tax=Enterobacteriaceae TaxID=543 RepID=UPI00092E59D5|nr:MULTISPECIES: YkgJ family cysteine cluster protein [Enterobacteriaceae]QOV77543.1 YkgJ family cysteine cluster protein [Enterobacter asburiae]